MFGACIISLKLLDSTEATGEKIKPAGAIHISGIHKYNLNMAGAPKKMQISQLMERDIFSFNGKSYYKLITIEHVGLGMYCIWYSALKQWRQYTSVKKATDQVIIAPVGRNYKG
jgi:hypothetical protein